MAATTSSPGLLDVESDALILCASKLNVKDLANMALSCKRLREIAYADPVWNIQCSIRWPPKRTPPGLFQFSGGRGDYLSRLTASHHFKFKDPVDWDFALSRLMIRQILFDESRTVFAAQGSNVFNAKADEFGHVSVVILNDHNARINCMRLFPAGCLGTSRNWTDNVLVTCSADHSIRLWGKVGSMRTLRGHSGGVNVISDKLLGQGILATGGMDSTVRLWTLVGSHRKRTPLQATLHGHESYVKELASAEHNSSILVSAAKDFKLRVWDVNTGACVGSAKGPGVPTSLNCCGCICYVSGGSTVAAIDLRTMRIANAVAVHPDGITATAISPSGWSLCTGGNDKTAKLWDTRSSSEAPQQKPVAVLGNHDGPVRCLHADSFKIISGGLDDSRLQVWDANDGALVSCVENDSAVGVSALACRGARVAVAIYSGDSPGVVRFRDFSDCAVRVEESVEAGSSKFWDM